MRRKGLCHGVAGALWLGIKCAAEAGGDERARSHVYGSLPTTGVVMSCARGTQSGCLRGRGHRSCVDTGVRSGLGALSAVMCNAVLYRVCSAHRIA